VRSIEEYDGDIVATTFSSHIARVTSLDDVHVSGHLAQAGHYEMLDALQPRHVIPTHQDMGGYSGYVDLAGHLGYELGRDLHVTANGNTLDLV